MIRLAFHRLQQNELVRFIVRNLIVFALPVTEIVLLRGEVLRLFGPKNGDVGLFNRDMCVPLLVGSAIYLYVIQKNNPISLSFRKLTIVLNLAIFGLTYGLLHNFDWIATEANPEVALTAFLLLLLATFFSGMFVAVHPSHIIKSIRAHSFLTLCLLLAIEFLASYYRIVTIFWYPIAKATGHLVYWVLNAVGFNVSLQSTCNVFIEHPSFRAGIGALCAGLEGVLLFILLFLVTRPVGPFRLAKLPNALLFFFGVSSMFFLNVLRITILFVIAVWLAENSSSVNAAQFFLSSFHSHLGWVLYLLGIPAIFLIFYKVHFVLRSPLSKGPL